MIKTTILIKLLRSRFFLHAQYAPADKRYSLDNLVQCKGNGHHRHEKDDIHHPRRQVGVHFHHIAQSSNHQIMDYIDAKAGARHVTSEGSRTVEAGLEPSHHREAHQPAVEAIEPTAQILRRSVVLTEGGDDQRRACNDGTGQ